MKINVKDPVNVMCGICEGSISFSIALNDYNTYHRDIISKYNDSDFEYKEMEIYYNVWCNLVDMYKKDYISIQKQ